MKDKGISISQAAEALRHSRARVDALLRKSPVLSRDHISGSSGKGGQLFVHRDALWLLAAAAALDDARVPKKAIRHALADLESHRNEDRVAVVYRTVPGTSEVVSVPTEQALGAVISQAGSAATVLPLQPGKSQGELLRVIEGQTQRRPRGRPRVDSRWLASKFDASDELGAEVMLDRVRELMGADSET